MKSEVEFEQSFDAFLNRREYDEAADVLFAVARAAYRAGWVAAGGAPPRSKKSIRLLATRKHDDD